MKKFSDLIIKFRIVIVVAVVVMIVLGAVGTIFMIKNEKINSDMLVYLPEGTSTSEGIEFLKEHFAVEGDAFVVVEGEEDDPLLASSIAKMRKEIKGITQFAWYGDVKSVETLASILGIGDLISTEEIKEYLRRPIIDENGLVTGYNYILLILFEYSPSTQEAFNVHKQIRAELHDELGREVAISGMTALADTVMTETMKEIPLYLIFGVLAVLIILFLATDSFLDPLILIFTLGTAVLVNMGSNYLFPNVSIISFAASGVLQLGITMDYAIFLLHTYKEERLMFNPAEAVRKALPRTIVNILASCLTTIGGFAALYFMRFTIGADLANVIIKGVALSMVTVVIVQPCLLFMFDKALQKTTHKKLYVNIEPAAKKIMKARYVLVVLAALLLVPSFFGQNNVSFSYLKIYEEPAEQTVQEELAATLQNQIIMAVPLDTRTGTQKDFMTELEKDEKISSVIGAYSVLNLPEDQLITLLDNPLIGQNPFVKTLFANVPDAEGNDCYYTLYLVGIEGDTEDEGAFATHKYMTEVLDKYFTVSYPLGVLTGVADMSAVTPKDFLIVLLVSAAIIWLVMSVLLKSPLKSFLMVLLIELAIFINISLNTIFSVKLNFMIYIIISSVQLGCTVDYAILMFTRFKEYKKVFSDTRTAAIKAMSSAFPALTTSASIIMTVCLAIFFVSNNLLVKQMAELMTRGAFISYVLVVTVLPCMLSLFTERKNVNSIKGVPESEKSEELSDREENTNIVSEEENV